MAHFGQVWIYYAVVGAGMGTSSECASFFVQNAAGKGILVWQNLSQNVRMPENCENPINDLDSLSIEENACLYRVCRSYLAGLAFYFG